jgi:hypothetical protein
MVPSLCFRGKIVENAIDAGLRYATIASATSRAIERSASLSL